MALFAYSKYKISIDPDSKKSQGLRVGDVVRRHYCDTQNQIYSLMLVLETGVDLIDGKESHYLIGALLEGDEPQSGQLLDFVRVTSLIDNDRSGALYLTASDSDAPYMDVIDGLGTERSLVLTAGIHRTETSFCFPLGSKVSNPEKLIIAYRIRASKPLKNVPLTIGYADETDGTDFIDITTEWKYQLSIITIDYPAQYPRELTITPNLTLGHWCEITDLNVVRLSDIATFSKATKARMGKITGIIDPVFGILEGYGAYFQNLYATRNVNIAGTLTAGDEKGFASTFYVGKIHKNVILNSAECAFTNSTVVEITSPVGIGKVRRISTSSSLMVQSSEWREKRVGQKYCFSIWIHSSVGDISVYQDEHLVGNILTYADNEWQRYRVLFSIASSEAPVMTIRLSSELTDIVASAPQLEAGDNASQYQPTDEQLNYTEDYGAWFSKGGIGGTIQNPLLKLNEDGSISSNNGSFVIHRDGSGHFAGGSMRWDSENVELGDKVTLRWINFGEDIKEKIAEQVQGVSLLDWVADWNSAKTVIDSHSVITPKIFAGVKNANNTITGVALGRFSISARNDQGKIITETIDGIYGFSDGFKTFFIDSSGNAQLGRADQSIKYNALKGKIEFGSEVALAWVGATYIDASGVFTGTLSADTVNAIRINAAQISAGTIDASRIDTASLKATLITAGNIEALTLNVTKGKIGGWSIDADSIFLGTKTNSLGAYTEASKEMTIGSAGIRGYKWRLEATGAGALAGESISWDAAGVVIFAPWVSLNWTAPIDNINSALGGASFPKLTNISSTGIYTGSLTAEQITAGIISADRIASGSISATKLDAASIKASIVNTEYINALNCSFVQGSIGGWTINGGSISGGQIIMDRSNNRIVVFGASSSSTTGHRTMLYHASNNDFGLYSTDSAGSVLVRLGSINQIAGWNINASQIYKNSVNLGADGSIVNSNKWAFNNDGSGSLASGNISWNTAGVITFSEAVSLNWATPVNNLNIALGGTSFPKLTYIGSTGIYTGTLTANQVNAVAISASSITTGALSADRIAAGSITATKLDAASVKSDIINTTYINGLACAFVRGTIGGFTIGGDNMSVGTIGGVGSAPIQIRSTASGSGYWYYGEYRPYGISMMWCQNNNAGHIVMGQIAESGNTVKTGFIGIQMMAWDNTEYFCLSTNSTLSGSKEVYNRIAGWGFDGQSIWKNSVCLGADGSIYNGSKWRLNNDGSGQIANGNISWNAAGTVTFSSTVSLNWTSAIQTIQNNLTAATDNAKTTVVDLTGLNQSTYYPVVLSLSGDKRATILLYNTLGSSGVPSWATHINGFSCECEWVSIGSGWGTRQSIRSILRSTYSWSSVLPFGDILQMTESSQEVIYLRGGGKYYFNTTNVGDISYKTSAYTMYNQTVSLKSSISQPTPDVDSINSTITNNLLPKVTQINSTGVYTGTIVASQITAGTIDASRINTDSIRSAIITATNINALTLTIDKGYIGGWSISSTQIAKNSVALSSDGSIVNGTKWRLNNDGSGQLAGGNITWDTAGNVTAKGAVFNNVRVQGSVRNPFVLNDSSIWLGGGDTSNQQNLNNYDNIIAVRGSWDEYINLPWTLVNSGRRVTLVNYRWGSNITQGYMSITAPSGQYFFEDGIQKSSITFSRELVELLGYGDSSTFFGWIIINRRDIMTIGRYGNYQQVLASGQVTLSGTSVSMKQFTYDGSRMSISRTGVGRYTIYMPWILNGNYIVQMTGYYTNTPIYATIMGTYTSYFQVQTQDDSSANEGSFCFQVFSTADWTT